MRALKIYSRSNFQIYNTVLFTRDTTQHISLPALLYFIAWILCCVPPSPFCPRPTVCLWWPPLWCLYHRVPCFCVLDFNILNVANFYVTHSYLIRYRFHSVVDLFGCYWLHFRKLISLLYIFKYAQLQLIRNQREFRK